MIWIITHRCEGFEISRVGELIVIDDFDFFGVQEIEDKVTADKSCATGDKIGFHCGRLE
jgi:hypothetical protein